MGKKLYRNTNSKIIAGVCSGIADYVGVDPTVVRILWILFCAIGGSGILAYIIAALIMPQNPS